MTWNYRVIHSVEQGEDWYAIHEVYYDAEGTPKDMTVEPVAVGGGTLDELREDIDRYQVALERPVLEAAAFREEEKG